MLATPSLYRRAFALTRRYRVLIGIALTAALAESLLSGAFTKLMQPLIDSTFVDKGPGKDNALFPLAIVAIFLGRGVLGYFVDILMAKAGRGVTRDLRTRLFDKCMRLPSHALEHESLPAMLTRLGSDCDQVAQAVVDGLKAVVQQTLQITAMLAVMLWTSWQVTASVLLLAPPLTWVTSKVGAHYRRIGHRIQVSGSELHQLADQALSGHQEVRIYGAQALELERYAEQARHHLTLGLKFEATRSIASASVQVLGSVALATLLVIASHEASQARLTAGAFVSLMTSMMIVVPSLKQIASTQGLIQRGIASAERVFNVMDLPDERDTGTRSLDRACGLLEFRNVCASYAGRTAPALSDISFFAWPGSVTAIVGRSGSGKSTLAKMIPRLCECSAGEILLDGHPIQEYRLPDLRRQIAMVSQKVALFDGTIAGNVAYGELGMHEAPEIARALQDSNAQGFVRKLPREEHTPVGTNGGNLSGGQRQRILLARAVLKQAPILILDEATASLDSESERTIEDALTSNASLTTTIVIAHRLSTIERADQIIVLDGGRIVECGTHAELMARMGPYASLHRFQFREPSSGGD